MFQVLKEDIRSIISCSTRCTSSIFFREHVFPVPVTWRPVWPLLGTCSSGLATSVECIWQLSAAHYDKTVFPYSGGLIKCLYRKCFFCSSWPTMLAYLSQSVYHCRCPLDKALRLSERSYLCFFFLFFLNTLYFHSRCGYVGSRLCYTEHSDRNWILQTCL